MKGIFQRTQFYVQTVPMVMRLYQTNYIIITLESNQENGKKIFITSNILITFIVG